MTGHNGFRYFFVLRPDSISPYWGYWRAFWSGTVQVPFALWRRSQPLVDSGVIRSRMMTNERKGGIR